MTKNSKRFPRSFFHRSAPVVARELLGSYLHRVWNETELVGKIVETEAYCVGDEACHAFRGKTKRNAIMFGVGGFSYVYFTYGMHYCFNITANEEGIAEAVLIRGVEPIAGIETMRELRITAKSDRDLTSGPGRLAQAFHLTREDNAIDLLESDTLFLTRGETPFGKTPFGKIPFGKTPLKGISESPRPENLIGTSTRIGINVAQEYPWRFFIEGNEYVSRAKPSVPGKIITRRRSVRNA